MNQQGIQALGSMPVHDHSTQQLGGIIAQTCLARAYINANQAIPTGAVTKILFNTEDWDVGNDFDADGVDSNFIAPSNAYYIIQSQIAMQNLDTWALYIYVNGVSRVNTLMDMNVAQNTEFAQGFEYVTAGLAIDIRVEHGAGANRNAMAGRENSFVNIFRIGA